MQQILPWLVASAAFGVAMLGFWWLRSRPREPAPLPTDWALSARPVFSSDERRAYRQLREAVPHHIVLAKVPLVRFSQPTDPQQAQFWYELMGAIHVGFAICSANGRVLAAIDLDPERNNSRRAQQIKKSVLAACRVRYLSCPADRLPSIPELQLLVPQAMLPARGPLYAQNIDTARDTLSSAAALRHRERRALWQDSGFFHDSFFGAAVRFDAGSASEFGAIGNIFRGEVTIRESIAPPAAESAPTDEGDRSPPVRH